MFRMIGGLMKLTKVQLDRALELRNTMVYDAILGNYKSYKKSKIEYSKLAVQDIEAIRQLPRPSVNVPLFSRFGMRMIYIRLCDAFRIKTPEEKLLNKMGKELKAKHIISQK